MTPLNAFGIAATTLDAPAEVIKRIPYLACPLCGSARMVEHATADCSAHPMYDGRLDSTMRWMRCEECSHVFTDGHWGGEALALIFAKTHPEQAPGHDLERQRYGSARIVEKVAEIVKPGGTWLDIGCGNGSLVLTAAEFGFMPEAIDSRPSTIAAMRAMGIPVWRDWDGADALNKRSVISMADVLEHTAHPRESLDWVRHRLERDGALFLSTPNMDTAVWRDLDAKQANPYWIEIEHYHNFTRDRLYRLLEEQGFEPVWYGVSQRYRCGMEVIARPASHGQSPTVWRR